MFKASLLPAGVATALFAIFAALKGFPEAGLLLGLGVLEISLSFDNAFVNAVILKKMDVVWQRVFIYGGIFVAVIGMRAVLPDLLVSLTTGFSPVAVWHMALSHPQQYKAAYDAGHDLINVIAGMFLLRIALNFIFDKDREEHWIDFQFRGRRVGLERWGTSVGEKMTWVKMTAISYAALLVAVFALSNREHWLRDLITGAIALAAYRVIEVLGDDISPDEESGEVQGGAAHVMATLRRFLPAGLITLVYLEILDATMSFDGVSAAFALTSNVIVIMAGLGIGALFIRSWTVYLVRSGQLEELPFLEHGAMYSIGVLALLSLVSIGHTLPEMVTTLLAVAFIGSAIVHSLIVKRASDRAGAEEEVAAPTA